MANTIIPLVPLPPEVFVPVPLTNFFFTETSVYEHMNLSRIHTKDQFKKAFRDSRKVLHPDRGGDPAAFDRVQNLKRIMDHHTNYYDTLNITQVDLAYNIPFQDIVAMKETTYYVEAGIFYFIMLLYGLAFTIDDDLKPSRKVIIPLILGFGAYEYYIHNNPTTITLIDLANDKVPIFVQKNILKIILAVFVAIIRTKYLRKKTPEKVLLAEIEKPHTDEEQLEILMKLNKVYQEKAEIKKKNANSWVNKLRDWISTGFTILLVVSLIRGFFD